MGRSIISCLLLLYCTFIPNNSLAVETIEVDLHIKNHKFIPDVLELPMGKKIIINVYNDDSTIEEFESVDLKREKIIPANSKAKIILAPLKEGEYKFFGEFNEETAQGKIIVKTKES
jgi:hypothetical protein